MAISALGDDATSESLDEALRASEARFRAFVAASDDVVYRMNPDWSVMRQLEGKAFLRDTGGPELDWLDRYIHRDDQAMVRAAIDVAIREKRTFALEHRVVRFDGSLGWTRSRATPVLDARGNVTEWIGAASDVTAAKAAEQARAQAEAASRQAEARYLTLFNAIDQGFCTIEVAFDADERPVDYRFLEVSPSFERQTGIADAAGRWMREIAPDQDQRWFDVYGQVALTGEPARFEDYSTPLGRWWEVFAFRIDDPATRRVGLLFRDISNRRRTEAGLRDREDRQAFLLELSDALRPLGDTLAIERTAVDLLGRKLGASRVFYATIESDGDTGIVRHAFADGVPAGIGRYQLSVLRPSRVPSWGAGQVTMSVDSWTDPAFDDVERAAYAALSTRAAIGVPLVKGGRLVALLAVNQATPRRWTEHEVSLVVEVAERTWAAIARAHVEAALHASEERFAQFAASSSDGLWIRDAATLRLEYASPAVATVFGLSPEALPDEPAQWMALIDPQDRDAASAHLEQARDGAAVVHEFRIRRLRQCDVRWIRNTDFPLRDERGGVQRIGGIAVDVTEAKLATERHVLLLGELQHRVRNILTVVRSVFARTVGAGGALEDIADHFTGRLDSLARTQVIVTRSATGLVDLENLIRDELLSVGVGDGPTVAITGPDIALPPVAAESIGLAIHELTTNALKYGALKVPGAKLMIAWSDNISHGGVRRLDLTWTEQGVPAVDVQPSREGFGSELIEEALPYRLGAETSLRFMGGGVRCTLSVPLPG